MAEKTEPTEKDTKGDQIRKGCTVRIVADERLRYRGEDNICKDDARCFLIGKMAGRDKIGEKGWNPALGPVCTKMAQGKVQHVILGMFHGSLPFCMGRNVFLSLYSTALHPAR